VRRTVASTKEVVRVNEDRIPVTGQVHELNRHGLQPFVNETNCRRITDGEKVLKSIRASVKRTGRKAGLTQRREDAKEQASKAIAQCRNVIESELCDSASLREV
jgi:hypothetical protein